MTDYPYLYDYCKKKGWHIEICRLPKEKPQIKGGKVTDFVGYEFKIINEEKEKAIYNGKLGKNQSFDDHADSAYKSLKRRRLVP